MSTQASLLTPGWALADSSKWVRTGPCVPHLQVWGAGNQESCFKGYCPLTPPTPGWLGQPGDGTTKTLAPVLELSFPPLKAGTGPLTAKGLCKSRLPARYRPQVTVRKQHSKQDVRGTRCSSSGQGRQDLYPLGLSLIAATSFRNKEN